MKISVLHAAQLTWWRNFWDQDPENYCELKKLQVALAPHNCRYVNIWEDPYIEFDTEQDYVMFVLRWS